MHLHRAAPVKPRKSLETCPNVPRVPLGDFGRISAKWGNAPTSSRSISPFGGMATHAAGRLAAGGLAGVVRTEGEALALVTGR